MPTGLPKTGRSDLADLRRLQPDAAQIQELKALTRDQAVLIQSQTRLVNQLTACLKAYSPVALQLFTKVQQHSTLVFLQTYPTPEAAKAASLDELTAVLKQAHHPTPTKVAQHLWQTLQQPHLQADTITTRTKARLMLALVSQRLPLVEQITAYDKEITRLFLSHPARETFRSLPGAAKRLAPRRLSGWGADRSRSSDAASVQATFGNLASAL